MKENQNIEFKQSWRDEYLKWICAFANTDGGRLIIGVDDRGTVKITDECKKVGLPEPEFKEEFGGFAVYFYKDIYTEENLRKMGLNERQIKAIAFVKEYKVISLSSFKTIVPDVSDKSLYRDLQDLVNRGLLKEFGKKRGRRYELS